MAALLAALGVSSVVGAACIRVEATEGESGADGGTQSPEIVENPDGSVTQTPSKSRDAAVSDVVIAVGECDDGNGKPKDLACTGLYADFGKKTLAANVQEYKPAFELWSDGAIKTRFIELPAGSKIDVSDMNSWTFPVGTKLWKEFRVKTASGERRVETRYLTKLGEEEWFYVAYQWSADEKETFQVPDGVEEVDGVPNYSIPGQGACDKCHIGRRDFVLGFEALALGDPAATGLTFTTLQKKGLLKSDNGNDAIAASKLRIPGTSVEKKALAYLHVNCGISCHQGSNGDTRVRLDLELAPSNTIATVKQTHAYVTGINQESGWRPKDADGNIIGGTEDTVFYRFRPADIGRSTVEFRMNHRPNDGRKVAMPPFASRLVDTEGVQAIRDWITAMTPANGYPAPAP